MKQTYQMPLRRRREQKTEYLKRIAFLKSGRVRLVVRKSNRYVQAQLVQFETKGDRTLAAAQSRELGQYGWHGAKNLPTAYLVGFLAGRKAIAQGTREAVLDIGMKTPILGSSVFAVLKGALDAGLKIPFDASALPSEERIRGKHIAGYLGQLPEEEKKKRFSQFLEKGGNQDIEKSFEAAKKAIEGSIAAKGVV